jgi:hypothetical protein
MNKPEAILLQRQSRTIEPALIEGWFKFDFNCSMDYYGSVCQLPVRVVLSPQRGYKKGEVPWLRAHL